MARASGYKQPPDWARLKKAVLKRDGHRCYSPHPDVCQEQAVTVDHLIPVAEGGSHELENLAAICPACHAVKTEAERIRGLRRAGPRAARERPKEQHPGLVGR